MAVTTIQSNNKLIQFAKDINREFVRENLFSPYMSDGLDAIIRRRYELKSGGETMNIPLVSKLNNAPTGVGTLVGNEERVDSYGMRVWLDWARNAVVTNKAEQQKDSADLFGEFKPLLSNWGKELQRDEIIAALMAFPSESAPTGLGSNNGQRTNGILFEAAATADKDTWNAANIDRVLYGALVSNYNATFATALATLDTTADLFTATNAALLKRMALNASPAIRPMKTDDGYEYYVCFVGSNSFRDLKASLITTHTTALQNSGKGNIIFQDGDIQWDGIIFRQVPEISGFVTDIWTQFKTAGASATVRTEPVFLCGQQAAAFCWGQMAKPTVRAEDDYGFITGVGVEMAYGTAKMFKKHPNTASTLVQWGVVTGFYASQVD
jgi:N4-gp56 family major capsid protein